MSDCAGLKPRCTHVSGFKGQHSSAAGEQGPQRMEEGWTTGSQWGAGLHSHRDPLQTSHRAGDGCAQWAPAHASLPAATQRGRAPCRTEKTPSLKRRQQPPPPTPGLAALCLSGQPAPQTRVPSLPRLFIPLSLPGRGPPGRQPLGLLLTFLWLQNLEVFR